MSVFDLPRLHFSGSAISRLPTGPASSVADLATGRVLEVREGENFGGNGHFLINANVVAVDLPGADGDTADSLVGRPVDFWGHHNEYLGTTVNRARTFDVDPASPWSTTVMVGRLGFGRQGRSHDTGYMFTGEIRGYQPPRWHRPDRVLHQFVVDAADGLNWLPEAGSSPAAALLREVATDGLVVQFVLSEGWIFGTIAPWLRHELRTYPAGRLFTGAGNLTLVVEPSGVQLNLAEPLPASELRTTSGYVVARLPGAGPGIVRAERCADPGDEPLVITDADGTVLLSEQEINIQADGECLILDHPNGRDDHEHDLRLRIRSYLRGEPAPITDVGIRQHANPKALPLEQGDVMILALDDGESCILSTDADGVGEITLHGLRAGTTRLSAEGDFFATVRVLPDDWHLDEIPEDQVTFEMVYREVLEPYEQLYSFMRDEVFSLADQFKVETYAKLVWQMCDPRNRDRTYYMPPSRDLSSPKARLLLKFLRRQQKAVGAPELLSSSDRERRGITSRGELVTALRTGVTVELAVMLQYLYAAYSVPTYGAGLEYLRRGDWTQEQLAIACGDGGESLDSGIRGTLLTVAREEMIHFLMVNNVLMAIGEPFYVPRIDFGTINGELPIPLDFSLEPLGIGSVQRFVEIERPADAVGEVRLGETAGKGPRPVTDYASLSELYGDIREGLQRIPGLFMVDKGRGGGEHHLFLRRSIDQRHPDYQMEVDDLPSALFAIDVVTEQGEGNVLPVDEDPDEESHYASFLRLSRLLADDLGWRPSYPVVRNPTLHEGNHATDLVSDPDARTVLGLFNKSYFMMLQLMVQHFGAQPDASLRRSALMNHAIDVMTGMMRPLAELLVTMPSGRRGRTAGPSFELDGAPGYLARSDVAARSIALRFDHLSAEAAKCPLVPSRVAEQSAFLSDYFRDNHSRKKGEA